MPQINHLQVCYIETKNRKSVNRWLQRSKTIDLQTLQATVVSQQSANPSSNHYRKQACCQEPASLPRAKCRALGKERFAESRPSATVGRRQNHICRGPGRRQRIPLGNRALCRGSGRRQRKAVGKSLSLPRSGSRQNMAVGKPVTTGKRSSPAVYFAKC